ncbi:hypothetical protein MCUN1_000369 [Malassezia cuniculi]|uniref:Cation efflux protein transmembrane domain-containing protein n=1 Tax=Malassezia cuniculi TaxID=948313 RepID=A0AAF0J9Q8_9BASI|nr:hypothetical protein MCUN1_000369 [Malassezia cuniculi]
MTTGTDRSRRKAEFVIDFGRDRDGSQPASGVSSPTRSRSQTRMASSEPALGLHRTASLQSIQAFAQLIDSRSGYYEECRVPEEELAKIKNAGVREFYERQNELLDGWREVDEILESQFPNEVMRRFADPKSLHKGTREPHLRLVPHGRSASYANFSDEDYATDEDSDSWSQPFAHSLNRRHRRVSERALTSLSEFWQSLEHSGGVIDSPAGSPPRSREPNERSLLIASRPSAYSTIPEGVVSENFEQHTQIENIPKQSKQTAGPSSNATNDTANDAPAPRPNTTVWTKADHERSNLLQIVPTHHKKREADAFVQFLININLFINLLLVVGKVVAVLSSNSVSLLASLVDSMLDLMCTVVIYVASRATAYRSWHTFYKYPVGKRRLEPLGVLIFSVLMVVSFAQVLLESLNRLWAVMRGTSLHDDELPWIGIVFMLITIVIKSIMWLLCRNSRNSSVAAISQDSANDVVFNIFTLVFPTLGAYLHMPALDPIGGGILSIYIISEWVATLADTTSKLTGKAASADDVSRCLYLVSRFSLVEYISGFELYHAGDTMVAEVDLVLPITLKLKEAHDIGEIITLSALAVGLTGYGVYEFYTTFLVWPRELREPLRSAVRAEQAGQHDRSAHLFGEALELARSLPEASLGSDRTLKLTGIAIALGAALEGCNRLDDAVAAYYDAFDEALHRGKYQDKTPPTPLERQRAVSLAQKIAEIGARGVRIPAIDLVTTHTSDSREGYLVWSVEELIRLVREHSPKNDHDAVNLSELELPKWVSRQDLGASVEALGAFYASEGAPEYAVPLYLQALGVLLPSGGTPTVAERCRAAVIMNNVSQAIASAKGGSVDQALAWAAKGFDLATITAHKAGFLAQIPDAEREWLLRFSGVAADAVPQPARIVEVESEERLNYVRQQCVGAQFVLLYNIGMLSEMQGDVEGARTLFTRSLRLAERLGLKDARAQAARAIARLQRS